MAVNNQVNNNQMPQKKYTSFKDWQADNMSGGLKAYFNHRAGKTDSNKSKLVSRDSWKIPAPNSRIIVPESEKQPTKEEADAYKQQREYQMQSQQQQSPEVPEKGPLGKVEKGSHS